MSTQIKDDQQKKAHDFFVSNSHSSLPTLAFSYTVKFENQKIGQ